MSRVVLSTLIALVLFLGDAKAFSFNCPPATEPKFTRVIDGDTIEIKMPGLPAHLQNLKIRLYGVDTPEKSFRAHCPEERQLGEEATKYARQVIAKAHTLRYNLMKWDKYGGRVNGDVLVDGVSLAGLLIREGYAVPYYGGKKTNVWCK